MRFSNLKHDKGVAGLTILLSLVVMLFVIGLLVFIFSIMGGEMQDATFTSTTSNVINESVHPVTAGTTFATNYRNAVCGAITTVYNGTGAGGILITAGNYTQTGCSLKNNTGTFTATTNWLVNYPVTFDANNSATDVIFDTTVGISGVTDWYSIFIVIGAMVVLILLTVIIITAIRGSGMMGGTTNATGSQNVGSA